MNREEAIYFANCLKNNYTVDLNDMEVFCDMAIKALAQEPTTKNDLALIHTEGLDEEIRCTMCTNSMKSDRGCDGSCVVDNDMYKAVMDAIEKRIQPSVTPQEPKKGHWVLTDVEGYRVWHCNCSECGKDPQDYIGGSEDWWLIKNNLPKFCPNCGSDNREVEE